MDSSAGRLTFTVLNSNQSKLTRVKHEKDPRSKRIPFRVIEVETKKLVNLPQDPKVEYGILSHCWCKPPHEEVTWDKLKDTSISELQDYLDDLRKFHDDLESTLSNQSTASNSETSEEVKKKLDLAEMDFKIQFRLRRTSDGKATIESLLKKIDKELVIYKQLQKIISALKAAESLELKYLWVDTCCINKSSSSELMETISCMGEWYSNAKICLVYLADIHETSFSKIIPPKELTKNLKLPEWSTRGWTLQEIAMCRDVLFYNADWKKIDEDVSKPDIYKICSVPPELYRTGGQIDLAASYVMHHAGLRKTTREEDHAYSLMGILGVKIPILYGEGKEAAISRLIDEVIRFKADLSAFNWIGFNAGSRLPGKSMYPKRLNAFPTCSPSPIRSATPVSISSAGINTIFEIVPITIFFEEVNYHRGLLGLLEDVALKHPSIDCVVSCRFRSTAAALPHRISNQFRVCCPLPILKREVKYAEIGQYVSSINNNTDAESLAGSWVLARSPGSGLENFFLCLLELAPVSGYVGWRIPSDRFRLIEQETLVGNNIEMCIR